MRKTNTLLLLSFLLLPVLRGQENLEYQKPSREILDLVDVPRAPSVLMDNAKNYMVLLYRDAYKSIEELSRKELRLGGLRIDPMTNIGSRTTYYNNLNIKKLSNKKAQTQQVSGLLEKYLK